MALRMSRVAREAGVPLLMGGPDPTAVPETYLYPAGDGHFEFERTVSRLMEMRSHDYLAAGHGAEE